MAESEIIFTVEEAPEGGYSARALGYSIFTEGDDLEDLRAMVRDAVECHFDEPERPRIIRLHFVRDEVLAV
jgi:predicted RNase H-like HicB family nuclease